MGKCHPLWPQMPPSRGRGYTFQMRSALDIPYPTATFLETQAPQLLPSLEVSQAASPGGEEATRWEPVSLLLEKPVAEGLGSPDLTPCSLNPRGVSGCNVQPWLPPQCVFSTWGGSTVGHKPRQEISVTEMGLSFGDPKSILWVLAKKKSGGMTLMVSWRGPILTRWCLPASAEHSRRSGTVPSS